MPEEKGLGSKFLGLFVETKEEIPPEAAQSNTDGQEKSAADIVAELAGQTGVKKSAASAVAAAVPTATVGPLPVGVAPAQVDFDAVFRNAGVDSGELDRVRKAEELLKGLPESTPVDVKRQIVDASLKAFGFDIAKIVLAAQNQLKALETYVRVNEQQTSKSLTDAQQQIAQLEDKVISLKADMAKRTEQLAAVSAAAEKRRGQVQRVIEFFNLQQPSGTKP